MFNFIQAMPLIIPFVLLLLPNIDLKVQGGKKKAFYSNLLQHRP